MNRATLQTAVKEAERFIERAKQVRFTEHGDWVDSNFYAASAACKRASMDLTKALAKIRRS